MKRAKLTTRLLMAHKIPMLDLRAKWARAGMLLLGTATLAACVTVNAPDGPIVIELNINITQEVIYRLAADAGNTIEENADIF
jgi:hypothetical protein